MGLGKRILYMDDLCAWAYEELQSGNRVKAGKLYRIFNKMKKRRDEWWEKRKKYC